MTPTNTWHGWANSRHLYAGFWARAWATFVDTVLVTIVTLPLLLAIYGRAYLHSPALVKGPWDFFISWILPGLAIIGFWMAQSATPGKMLIKACIVDAATGGKPTQGQLVRRYFGYLLSALPLCVGFLWAAFDPKKQGWHDKVAGTVVVYRQKAVQPSFAPAARCFNRPYSNFLSGHASPYRHSSRKLDEEKVETGVHV